jgi:hypothetical protein
VIYRVQRRLPWKRLIGVLALPLTTLAFALALSTPAQAAVTCGPYVVIDISGGHASYRECSSGPYVRVDGRIKDTGVPGLCAWLRVTYNQQTTVNLVRACATGTEHTFNFGWRTSTDAFVQLYLAGP